MPKDELVSIADIGFMSSPLMEVKDPELKEHTTAILNHANASKAHVFSIAVHLLAIKDKELWRKDGFDGIGDYALKVLGYKPVTTSNMISIARTYLTPKEDGDYHSILARADGVDYTMNQLLEVKSLGEETVIDMDKAGEISPDMSVRELRKVVKEKKGKTGDSKGKGKGKGKEKASKAEQVERSAKPVTDIDLALKRVIESIPTIINDERFKDNGNLCRAGKTFLQMLQEVMDDTEDEDEV